MNAYFYTDSGRAHAHIVSMLAVPMEGYLFIMKDVQTFLWL